MWLISVRPRPGNNPNLTSHKDTKLRSFRAVRKDLLAVITVINVWCFSPVTDAEGVGVVVVVGGGTLVLPHSRDGSGQ